MSYQDQLSPWVIYRRLPNFRRLMIKRFRRRGDAEGYLKALQSLEPHAEFEIAFEAIPELQEIEAAIEDEQMISLIQAVTKSRLN
jgi:hypothetical protein